MSAAMPDVDYESVHTVQLGLQNELKSSALLWEDLLTKTGKLQNALKTTIGCFGPFLDTFQKLADLASQTTGGSKEISVFLTKICVRQKNLESSLKSISNQLASGLTVPYVSKIDEWRRSVSGYEREYQKRLKKAKQQLKKTSTESAKIEKKLLKRNQSCVKNANYQFMNDKVDAHQAHIRDIELQYLRKLMLEERTRFCALVNCFCPVFELQLSMFSDFGQAEDLLNSLRKLASEPEKLLPEAEAQVHLALGCGTDAESLLSKLPVSRSTSFFHHATDDSLGDGRSLCSSHSSSTGEAFPNGRPTLTPKDFATTDSGIHMNQAQPNSVPHSETMHADPGGNLLRKADRKSSLLSIHSNASSGQGSQSCVAYKSASEYMAMVYASRRQSSTATTGVYQSMSDTASAVAVNLNRHDFTLGRVRDPLSSGPNSGLGSGPGSCCFGEAGARPPYRDSKRPSPSSSEEESEEEERDDEEEDGETGKQHESLSFAPKAYTVNGSYNPYAPAGTRSRPALHPALATSATDEESKPAVQRRPRHRHASQASSQSRNSVSGEVLYPDQAIPMPSHYGNLNQLQTEARRKYSMVLTREQAHSILAPQEEGAPPTVDQTRRGTAPDILGDPYAANLEALDALAFGSSGGGSTATIASSMTNSGSMIGNRSQPSGDGMQQTVGNTQRANSVGPGHQQIYTRVTSPLSNTSMNNNLMAELCNHLNGKNLAPAHHQQQQQQQPATVTDNGFELPPPPPGPLV